MDDKINVIALRFVGGRVSNQPSHAVESHKYGDPAKSFEFPAERERKKKLKQQQKPYFKIKGR